jgi:5-methylcytosine-specific restriction endonuclease McrA
MIKLGPGRKDDKAEIISNVCKLVSMGQADEAQEPIAHRYPMTSRIRSVRKWSEKRATRIFVRDGFIDRYTGSRLVFPGALRALSLLQPAILPAHPNWKSDQTHPSYWDLYPTLDHMTPIALGGEDVEANIVTVSMRVNSAKSNWLLEDLGWKVLPVGLLTDWDGLCGWFLDTVDAHTDLLAFKPISRWHKALSY